MYPFKTFLFYSVPPSLRVKGKRSQLRGALLHIDLQVAWTRRVRFSSKPKIGACQESYIISYQILLRLLVLASHQKMYAWLHRTRSAFSTKLATKQAIAWHAPQNLGCSKPSHSSCKLARCGHMSQPKNGLTHRTPRTYRKCLCFYCSCQYFIY